MTVRAFVVLLLVTVFAIWVGDRVAADVTAPGLERTFSVLLVAAAIVAPVAWVLGRIGWIRGRLELGRKRAAERRDGGRA